MSNYTPIEQHERNAYFDKITSKAYKMLTDPSVEQAIDAQYLSKLKTTITGLILPNVIDCEVVLPKNATVDNDFSTLVIAHDYEDDQLYFDMTEMHLHGPEQAQRTFQHLAGVYDIDPDTSWGIVEDVNQAIRSCDYQYVLPSVFEYGVGGVATYMTRKVDLPSNHDGTRFFTSEICARPNIVMPLDYTQSEIESAGLLIHEAVHVNQAIKYPVRNPDRKKDRLNPNVLRAEMEAYAAQSEVALTLYQNSENPDFIGNHNLLNTPAHEVSEAVNGVNQGNYAHVNYSVARQITHLTGINGWYK